MASPITVKWRHPLDILQVSVRPIWQGRIHKFIKGEKGGSLAHRKQNFFTVKYKIFKLLLIYYIEKYYNPRNVLFKIILTKRIYIY